MSDNAPTARAPAASTVIDDKTCNLICRSFERTVDGGYLIVVYEIDENSFCAYKSNSEGLWRLNLLDERGRKEKGCSYITTTQLHMDLQCFINDNWMRLPEVDFATIEDIFRLSDYKDPDVCVMLARVCMRAVGCVTPLSMCTIRAQLDCGGSEYSHDVFRPLVLTCHNWCFNWREFRVIYGDKSAIRAPTADTYMRHMQELLGINADGSVRQEALDLEYSVGDEGFFHHTRNAYSQYMSDFFTASPDPSDYVCEVSLNIDSIRIRLQIYQTIIALTDDNTVSFRLYYGRYNMPRGEHYRAGGYKIIINLVPISSRLSRLGLNDKFIRSGIFVYKMFDYYLPEAVRQIDRGAAPVYAGKYQFAGDLLTDMWPLNVVTEARMGGSYSIKSKKTMKRKQVRRGKSKSRRF